MTTTGTIVCVVTHAGAFDPSVAPAWAAHVRSARRAVVIVLSGPEDKDTASRTGEVRAFGLAVGSVASTPELVARLRAAFDELGATVVLALHPQGADLETRAACRAVAAAVANGPQRSLLLCSRGNSAASTPIGSSLALAELRRFDAPRDAALATTAVLSTWNKRDDVRANLEALRAQTVPFDEIVAVDNHSQDGTAEMIAAEFPEVRLIRMPHDRFGACETFNIGFKASRTPLTAILDDDIVMPPNWLEKATERIAREPATTAILSTQVVEPGMPEEYRNARAVNEERYMSTFRGCASLARSQALREADYYDERLFIYGNERDLTCRLLNLGYRVLQYPGCGVFHKTPFGIKMGKRSLFYHARNAWLSMLKYAPFSDLVKMPWLVLTKVVMRKDEREKEGTVRDAVGTIGIGRSLRETKGAWWVVTKAAFSVLANVPYCLMRRRPVKSPDFELPIH
jgi:GT2 family glycosyltransferase